MYHRIIHVSVFHHIFFQNNAWIWIVLSFQVNLAVSLPFNFNTHYNYIGAYVGSFYESVNFNDIYETGTTSKYRHTFAREQTAGIIHQFYGNDRKTCIRMESSLNGGHDAVIEVILSECQKNVFHLFNPHKTGGSLKNIEMYKTPFSGGRWIM